MCNTNEYPKYNGRQGCRTYIDGEYSSYRIRHNFTTSDGKVFWHHNKDKGYAEAKAHEDNLK